MRKKDGLPWNRRDFIQGMGATLATASMMPQVRAQGQLPIAGHSDWTRFAYDIHNTRFNSREATLDVGNVARLRPKWRREIPAPLGRTHRRRHPPFHLVCRRRLRRSSASHRDPGFHLHAAAGEDHLHILPWHARRGRKVRLH